MHKGYKPASYNEQLPRAMSGKRRIVRASVGHREPASSHEGRSYMRGLLIGVGIGVICVGAIFAILLVMADAMAPDQTEVRVEVTDALRN